MTSATKQHTEAWKQDVAHVIHPYSNLSNHPKQGPTIMVKGEGCYVYDDQGKRYLEGMSGLWCASLGFSEPRLGEAAQKQFQTLPYYHLFNHHSHPIAIELAAVLAELTPKNLNHILFANSGSEANDSAVKMVWYYHNAINKPKKKKIIARHGGYHGITVASGSLTGLPPVHAAFDLPIQGVLHTDCPSYYHFGLEGESEADYVNRLAKNLEDLILAEGPETIGAFIAEPVIGAGGVLVPPAGYFEKIQAVLKRHDILFIVDEVICGFGRTGAMFGSQTYGIEPDMMTVAKGLSAAYQPISALIVSDQIKQAMLDESQRNPIFAHGLTYAAHPICAAVALETLKIYKERAIVDHVSKLAPYFQSQLANFNNHPLVGNTRGVGLLGALELVKDKATKTPFPDALGLASFVQRRAAEHGLIVRAIKHTIALCPPLISTKEHIDEIVIALNKALDDATQYLAEQGKS
ncbi:aminotransferase class III-fold pyridoxal phosphate-dependent enzyme [Alcaligenaceae bacterium]|nr:aminotransferase class III-fold pyridoxal phosphate-dependent enzyme [Alcaligenaceae bacterium]